MRAGRLAPAAARILRKIGHVRVSETRNSTISPRLATSFLEGICEMLQIQLDLSVREIPNGTHDSLKTQVLHSGRLLSCMESTRTGEFFSRDIARINASLLLWALF
jgi:hypothetical protein